MHPPTVLVCWSDFDQVFGIFCGTVGDSTTELVVEETGPVKGAVDALNDKLYWARSDAILRANLDGSNVLDIVRGLDAPTGIGFAEANGKIYWLSVAPPEVPAASPPGLALLVLLLLGGSSALLAWPRAA